MEYEERAEILSDKTVLTETEAEVQALVENGADRDQIADELDMAVSTVDTHKQNIKQRLNEVRWTKEEIDIDESHLYDRIQAPITTDPLERVDIAYGKTPERAIVNLIQQRPTFIPNRKNGYVSPMPELIHAKPQDVCEFDFDTDSEEPIGVDPVIQIDHDTPTNGNSRLSIKNVWVVVETHDGLSKEKFSISLTASTDSIQGQKYISDETHQWKVERMG